MSSAGQTEVASKTNKMSRFHGLFVSPKYGDGDVSSKRRKSQELPSSTKVDTTASSPKETISSPDLLDPIDFEQFASESCVNSSLLEHLDRNLDFKGGLLLGSKTLQQKIESSTKAKGNPLSSSPSTTPEKEISAKNTLIISSEPSPTSKGFENTFKLLQNQISCKSRNSSLKSHRTECNLSPIKLDVEFEAQQRLYELEETGNENCALLNFLHAFTTKTVTSPFSKSDSENVCEAFDRSNDELNAPDCEPAGLNLLYHATKRADGTKRLRVLRSTSAPKSRVLCGNRVSQMTRAYDDIEAVTRLLEEKEKDLELTVQIGKELLTQNNTLENRISELEADLKISNDDRAQLVHELNKKNELIAVLTNDAEECGEAETPTFSKSVTLDLLQRKVSSLQDENKTLKMEATQLAKQTDDVEAHERQLMDDISTQLNEANSQFESLSLELERQREENRLQHEQIVNLTARLSEAEMRLHQLTHDNDENVSLLGITKQNQNSLALELVEFKQRYQEVLDLLHETQEQLRKQRKRAMPQARSGSSYMSGGMSGSGYGFLQPDSLQSELIESTFSENSLDSGISTDRERANDRIGRLMSQLGNVATKKTDESLGIGVGAAGGSAVPSYQKVFDTVRCASKSGNYADSSGVNSLSMSQLGAMSMSSSSGPRMSSSVAVPAGSYYRHDSFQDNFNLMGAGKTFSCESLVSQPDENYPTAPEGVPGAPGAKDLEAALKRLTPAEVLARRAMLSYAPAGTYNYDEQQHSQQNSKYQQPLSSSSTTLPFGIRTPDSIMSTGSSGISSTAYMSSSSVHQWRLPEKLQIIKPMEGSQTLHHWSRLATPTLSGLLEKRPGVTVRGSRGLDDLGMDVYTLEDVEEDINEDLPGKQFEAPGCTYTFTNSMVMHPDDGIVTDLSFLSQSQMSSRMASNSTSRQPSCPPTPRSGLSRKNSCSTFSVNLGLASMLNERGIKAVTPSALNTPAGPNFSPTVTPCNSPEGSPTRDRSPEPLFGLISSGADLIRRKLMGADLERQARNQQKQQQQKIMLSRLERRALRSLRLVEKVESIGLENIISSRPCGVSQLASGIANRSSSPMAQLNSLRSIHTSSNSMVDDIHFERDQIKSVLNKGLNKSAMSHDSSSAYTSDNDGALSDSSDNNSLKNDVYRTPTNTARRNTEENIAQKTDQSQSKSKSTTAHSETPAAAAATTTAAAAAESSVANSTVTLPSQAETRIKQIQRQKSRRNLKNGMAAQRPDLGRVRNDLGKVGRTAPANATNNNPEKSVSASQSMPQVEKDSDGASATQSITQSFVGSISSLFFGRKGGWL